MVVPQSFSTVEYILPSELGAGRTLPLLELDMDGQAVVLNSLWVRLGASAVQLGNAQAPTVRFSYDDVALTDSAITLPAAAYQLVVVPSMAVQGAAGHTLKLTVETGLDANSGVTGGPWMVYMAGMLFSA